MPRNSPLRSTIAPDRSGFVYGPPRFPLANASGFDNAGSVQHPAIERWLFRFHLLTNEQPKPPRVSNAKLLGSGTTVSIRLLPITARGSAAPSPASRKTSKLAGSARKLELVKGRLEIVPLNGNDSRVYKRVGPENISHRILKSVTSPEVTTPPGPRTMLVN